MRRKDGAECRRGKEFLKRASPLWKRMSCALRTRDAAVTFHPGERFYSRWTTGRAAPTHRRQQPMTFPGSEFGTYLIFGSRNFSSIWMSLAMCSDFGVSIRELPWWALAVSGGSNRCKKSSLLRE
jgi:hypothetical protein